MDNCHPVTAGECLEGTCFTGFLSAECDDDYSGKGSFILSVPKNLLQDWQVIIKLKQTTIVLVVIWMPSSYLVTPMRSANNSVVTTQCVKVELFHYIHESVFLTDRLVSSRDSRESLLQEKLS